LANASERLTVYHSDDMDTFDSGEFLRIAEHYRRMSDDEILLLLPQSSELTPFAQQALANEVRSRGLQGQIDEQPSTKFKPAADRFEREAAKFRNPAGDDSPDSPYAEERKPVELCTVWSERDALQVQTILDGRGIPFFMGAEKATGVDEVTSDFAKGVVVRVMQIGLPWAQQGLKKGYHPEDDQTPKEPEEVEEIPVRCPKCRSTEVVFEGLTADSTADEASQKYQWSCDSCGHQWEDDGVPKE
jgi:DNA-directed RNA polymerase subunit M/transcription elongation factor TFIIS